MTTILKHPMAIFCFSVLVSLILCTGVTGQDIKPGASPVVSVGNPDASVSIEVFNDYQCPPCASFNEELKRIEARYKKEVRIIFRNFPLTRMHENALPAARAAEAAGIQGKFTGMINLLYETRNEWAEAANARELFISHARKLGLDIDRFTSDMDGDYVRKRISLDTERAMSLKVTGTPTVFVNGKVLSPEEMSRIDGIIKRALDKAGQ